jgi:hypothetical protein
MPWASFSTCVPFPHCNSRYTPNRYIHPQCKSYRNLHNTPNRNMHPQCISHYTPNHNIHPQCKYHYTSNPIYTHNAIGFVLNLCCVRVERHVSSIVYFDRNNGGTADEYHIGIRRAIAEVSIRTEFLIWTSEVEG